MSTYTENGNTGWSAARALSDEQRRAESMYLNPEPEETLQFVIVGEPLARFVHWLDGKPTSCEGSRTRCPHCVRGPKRRFQFNVYVYLLGEGRPRILTGGMVLERALSDLNEKLGSLNACVVELSRHGALKETAFSARDAGPIPQVVQNEIQALNLPALAEVLNRAAADLGDLAVSEAPAASTDYFGAPVTPGRISDEVAAQMIARIKPQPAEAVAAFLRRFGVSRIRDLRAVDEQIALALISEMEAASATSLASPEIDPFA